MSHTQVLIVDDEGLIGELLAEDFEDEGFVTQRCCSPQEAEEVLAGTSFDVVVSDIKMPGGSGVDLFKRTRQLPQAPLFVFISGFSDLSVATALDLGAIGIFAKPLDTDGLLECVQRNLRPLVTRWQPRPQYGSEPARKLLRLTSAPTFGWGGFSCRLPAKLLRGGDDVGWEFARDGDPPCRGVGRCVWVEESGAPEGTVVAGIEIREVTAELESVIERVQAASGPAYIPKLGGA